MSFTPETESTLLTPRLEPFTELIGIPEPEKIQALAPQVLPRLSAAVERGGDGAHSAEDILQRCVEGTSQLWLVLDNRDHTLLGVVVTSVDDAPQKRICSIDFCQGEQAKNWLPWLEAIENWARSLGCNQISIRGRRGWARVFPDYAESYTVISKELNDGQ